MRLLGTTAATIGALVFIPIMLWVGIGALVTHEKAEDPILAVGAIVVSALAGYTSLAMWRELKPVPPQWSSMKWPSGQDRDLPL